MLARLCRLSSHTSRQARGTVEGDDRSRQFQAQCWGWHFLGRTNTVHLLGVCVCVCVCVCVLGEGVFHEPEAGLP